MESRTQENPNDAISSLNKTLWKRNERHDFLYEGRATIVVLPEISAPGNPWVWRAEFFDAFPSADMALLERGWHLVYYKVSDMYGCPEAIKLMNGFHRFIIKLYALNPKPVIFGFSRGGLYAFNYAAEYPGEVSCLYLDAAVLDIRSWPGGKDTGQGSLKEWADCMAIYGLTEDTARDFRGNPLDKVEVVAKAGIPIIAVAGDADMAVPFLENSAILEKKYTEYGGNMKMIVKPGIGHHPHSLEDPHPIIDFILENSEMADSGSGLDAELLAEIPKQMERFVEQEEIAGSVTLVARHGHVASLEAVGFQDMGKGVRMKKDTIFRIASMTKPITAAGIMILQEAGKLSVDDPIEKHLPEFRDMWLINEQASNNMTLKKPSRPITIRDILTHTSGLSEARRDIPLKSISDVALIAAHLPLQFEPGSQWRYGGSGMITAGRLIEVVSGQPYDQFLHDHIFLPLGMKDTFFFPSKDVEDRIAVTYEHAETGELVPQEQSQRNWNFPLPSGGLYSTATDMGVWMQTILSGGAYQGVRILSEQSVKEMTSLQTGDLNTGFTEGMGFGLGWGLVRNPAGVTKMLSPGTFGHGGAYGTQNWADPEKDMIFILMIQRQGFGNGDASNIRQKFQEIAVSAIAD